MTFCFQLSVSAAQWLCFRNRYTIHPNNHLNSPDSKVHGANMGPIWGQQDPGGPHVGPINFVIWVFMLTCTVIGVFWIISHVYNAMIKRYILKRRLKQMPFQHLSVCWYVFIWLYFRVLDSGGIVSRVYAWNVDDRHVSHCEIRRWHVDR